MKYLVYYQSKSHGKKFGKKTKRRWFVNDPAHNPAEDGRPVWSYKKDEAMKLTRKQSQTVMGMAMIGWGYFGLKRIEA
jgi:hypothetical protein